MKRQVVGALCASALVGCGVPQTQNTAPAELQQYSQQITRATQSASLAAKQLDFSRLDELTATSVVLDENGQEHVRFNRSHRGLRVVGGDFVIHGDASGSLRDVSSELRAEISRLDIRPEISALDAANAALKLSPVKGTATAELIINAHERAPSLAYDVFIQHEDENGPFETHYLIDAKDASLQDSFSAIESAAAVGTGNSLYLGQVSIGTNSVTGGFEMRDTTRGGFYTVNMKNRSSGGTIFTDTDNVWGSGTTSDAASAAVDAHYGQTLTYDYYKNIHGRNGIDGAGNVGYSRVHYSQRYNNAYWSDSCFCMTYGDGDGSSFTPLVAIDVAGHEMTHGVTSRTANLTYSGESGGLNEATSDIFGSMVEFYANNAADPGDYLIGEVIYTPTKAGDALRYMYNPSLDGSSANCWSSTVGSLDVHYSSGVANHFFFLLAEGSNGATVSPTCNGTTVTGIGRAAAEKIWYRALTVYMTSSTNYAGARAASLKAATDLYGAGSTQYNAVAAAWSAVSVN